jgi:hypothetical protein
VGSLGAEAIKRRSSVVIIEECNMRAECGSRRWRGVCERSWGIYILLVWWGRVTLRVLREQPSQRLFWGSVAQGWRSSMPPTCRFYSTLIPPKTLERPLLVAFRSLYAYSIVVFLPSLLVKSLALNMKYYAKMV